jgi:hypothetical protein
MAYKRKQPLISGRTWLLLALLLLMLACLQLSLYIPPLWAAGVFVGGLFLVWWCLPVGRG